MSQTPHLIPVCEITGPLAGMIQPRLLSCTLVDAAGEESDSLTLTLASGDLAGWPDTGQLIGCKLGYKGEAIVDMGMFKLQRISQRLYPDVLTLTATSARFDGKDPTELKRVRSRSWRDTTLGGIVSAIAGRHGLSPRVHGGLAGVPIDHLDQTEEGDLKLLHRLAARFDAVCKPVEQLLVFAPRGQVKTLTGKTLTPVTIEHPPQNQPRDPGYTNATISSPEKRQFNGVTAHWYHPEQAREMTEQQGSAPRKRLAERFASKTEALDAIAAELHRIERQGDLLQLECPGNPMLAAENLLTLQGFPISRLSGRWSIDRVTHRYNGSYRCSVEASRPMA